MSRIAARLKALEKARPQRRYRFAEVTIHNEADRERAEAEMAALEDQARLAGEDLILIINAIGDPPQRTAVRV
jgi:hypothetical protein